MNITVNKGTIMLQPLRGKILVQILQDNKRTESGLYLAGVVNEVPHRGKVICIGKPYIQQLKVSPYSREIPWGFVVGHIVHFKRVWDNAKDSHYILRRDQIFAIEHEEKAYAIGEYIIIRRINETVNNKIFVPSHFETEVAKEIAYGEVMSVGRESKLGVGFGDKIIYYRNEGLKVAIPLQEELWALKARAILALV